MKERAAKEKCERGDRRKRKGAQEEERDSTTGLYKRRED